MKDPSQTKWHGIPRTEIPWFPTVDAQKCIGCELCFVTCGRDVYEIAAGICGFRTTVHVRSEDAQHVLFDMTTDCEKIRQLGARSQPLGPLDAFQEINPASCSRVMETARASLTGCCTGCAVPVGLFKAMQGRRWAGPAQGRPHRHDARVM